MVSEHLLGGNTEALQWEASRHHVSLQPRLCLFGLWVVQTQGCMFFSHCETVIWTAIRHLENRVLGPHMLLDWSRLRKPSSLHCVIYALCVLRLTSIFFHAWENKAVFCPCIQSKVSFYFVSILRIRCLALYIFVVVRYSWRLYPRHHDQSTSSLSIFRPPLFFLLC